MKTKIVEPVGILGVGVEGRATISYLLGHGYTDITALDRSPIDDLPPGISTCFGASHLEGLGRFATLFRSPGIRPDHPALQEARATGARVTSAVSFFLEQCPAEVVGVTGTLGKGTCTSLCAAMIAAGGDTVHLGGNIGLSPLAFLDEVEPDHRVVLEISSFQAMDLAASPRVAVILKTTSEHLDWHTDRDEYLDAKANLLAHQPEDGVVIFHADTPGAERIAATGGAVRRRFSLTAPVDKGIFVRDEQFFLADGRQTTALPIAMDRLKLAGVFNRENIAAAILAAMEVGVPLDVACAAAETFEGLPHRLQFVTSSRGVRFYNDSYATRPDATIGALASFEHSPLSLILGGSEKNADFSELASVIAAHPMLRHISLIGATGPRLRSCIAQASPNMSMNVHESFQGAIEEAVSVLDGEGAVLLSPACASFGLFKNYKIRGEQFMEIAKRIAKTVT